MNYVFSMNGVIGPFLFTQPLSENVVEKMEKNIFEFFVPIEEISKALQNIKAYPLIGNNVYQYSSSLVSISLHMGAIMAQPLKDNYISYTGNSIYNSYDANWNLVNQVKTEMTSPAESPFAGISIILTVTNELNTYIGVRSNEIKSKSTVKNPSRGLAILLIQPVYEKPKVLYSDECLEGLLCTRFIPDNDDDRGWVSFGLNGELMDSYDFRDFMDEDVPPSQWASEKMNTSDLFLENSNSRYKLTKADGHYKLYQVVGKEENLQQDNILWSSIIWDRAAVKINEFELSPLLRVAFVPKV